MLAWFFSPLNLAHCLPDRLLATLPPTSWVSTHFLLTLLPWEQLQEQAWHLPTDSQRLLTPGLTSLPSTKQWPDTPNPSQKIMGLNDIKKKIVF